MNISIMIADTNREYVSRLSEVLQQYEEFTIQICTSKEKLLQALRNPENKKTEIVLFDPDISDEKLTFPGVKLPICLYSDEACNAGWYADFLKIRKYQRISSIYKQVIQEYSEKAGYSPELDHTQRTTLIGVYSPAGGSGKTTVALAIASSLAERGKSVLFLSAEQICSSFVVNSKKEDGITALLSSVMKEQVNFSLKLKGLMKQGLSGMFYVEGFERVVDYNDVTKDEMTEMLRKIKECGACDIVVIDMESNLDIMTREIMDAADRVVIVERPGELSLMKMNLFTQQAVFTDYRKKMVAVRNFAESNSAYCRELSLDLAGQIHHYANLPLKNMIKTIVSNREVSVDSMIG